MYQNYCRLRDERGITDYRVSVETGIPMSTFTDWKNGRSKPKTEKLLKLAKLFHCSIEDFIDERQ